MLSLDQALTTHVNLSMDKMMNVMENTMMSSFRDFVRMKPPTFIFSKVVEDH